MVERAVVISIDADIIALLLSSFGESLVLSDANLYMAEQYIVQVWSGVRSKPTSEIFA